jgi:FHS family Na+ dependent glucose MFS transporter 1
MDTHQLAAARRSSDQTLKIAQTAGYYGGYVVIGIFAASLGPTLPALAEHTGSHLSQISFLFTTRSVGYLLGSVVLGRLYDRLPAHSLMAGMLVLITTLMALTPVAPSLVLLALVQLLWGAAISTLDVGVNTLLLWVHRGRSGPYMTAGHIFFGAGALFTPVVVAQIMTLTGDISWAYWALALPALLLAAYVLRLPNPPRRIDLPAGGGEASGRARPLLVLLTALFLFLYVGVESGFGGWIFTYATTLGMGSETTIAYLNAAFWTAFTVGCVIATPLASRFRPRHILWGDVLGCLASLTVILLWSGSPTALWIGTIGAGLSLASVFPMTLALAERRMPITSTVTRWFFVGAGAGGMVLPWLIGQLFESIGPLVAMYGMIIDLLLAAGVLTLLIGSEPPRRVAEVADRR